MDIDELTKKFDWLEKEHRKDRAVISELQEKINSAKKEAEKQKESEKVKKEDKRGAYEPNTILKSQIDVRFPFGLPTAEVKNGYLNIA